MIYLSQAQVEPLLSMPDAIEQVDRALRDRSAGQAFDMPRQRTRLPGGSLNIVQGASLTLGLLGFKAYYVLPHGHTSVLNLINRDTGRLEAILEAHWLGMIRTGAATGVAARQFARPDARVMGMFGSGRQAQAQLEAVCAVRPIEQAKVYSRDRAKLEAFCDRMATRVKARVEPARSPQEAVDGSDVVVTITRGGGPVFDGQWLAPGTFVAAAGVNAIDRKEIDAHTVARSRVVVDSRETARVESGDLLSAYESGMLHWETVPELGEALAGRARVRESADDIVLFESHGMALQDIYCGAHVLGAARAAGTGQIIQS